MLTRCCSASWSATSWTPSGSTPSSARSSRAAARGGAGRACGSSARWSTCSGAAAIAPPPSCSRSCGTSSRACIRSRSSAPTRWAISTCPAMASCSTRCAAAIPTIPGNERTALRSLEHEVQQRKELEAALRATLRQRTGAMQERNAQDAERFRLLVESVKDYAIFLLDVDGRVSSWNVGAERIKGYRADEIIGQHFSRFYPPETAGRCAEELEIAAKEGRFEDEGWRVRKDGSRFWANVIITAVHDETGKLIGFGKVTRDSTERMQAQRALQREIAEKQQAEMRLRESEKSLRDLSLH